MFYTCPLCASTAVTPAGSTDWYVSLVCQDCHAWSTVPLPRREPRPERRVKPPPGI